MVLDSSRTKARAVNPVTVVFLIRKVQKLIMLRFVAVCLVAFGHLGRAAPLVTLEDLEVADDTASVGSYIREVRAAPPNYHKSYENEGDGEIGYSRKKSGGGKKGYQHFDTFHKKAGDAYEFEKQDSYGLEDEGEQDGAHSQPKEEKAAKYQEVPSEHDAGEYESEGQEEGSPDSGSSGDNGEEGAVEAEGHDAADYILPEKYEYGAGEEYNFK